MFCQEWETQIEEMTVFCHKCGTKVVYEDTDKQPKDTVHAANQ